MKGILPTLLLSTVFLYSQPSRAEVGELNLTCEGEKILFDLISQKKATEPHTVALTIDLEKEKLTRIGFGTPPVKYWSEKIGYVNNFKITEREFIIESSVEYDSDGGSIFESLTVINRKTGRLNHVLHTRKFLGEDVRGKYPPERITARCEKENSESKF